MAELERLVQRFEVDASSYLLALDQTRLGLTGLQPIASQTEQQLTRGFQRSASSAARSSSRIVASSGRMRFALQNAAFQVADIAQQLEAGVPALRVFAVQGAQVAGAFGPWGAVLGAAIGVTGGLAGALLGVSRNSRDAADDIETLTDRIDALATKATDVDDLIEKFEELSEGMRRIGEADLEVRTLPDLETDLASARVAFDGLLESILEGTRIVERAQFDEMAASIVDLLNAMRQGKINFDEFIRRLGEFRDIPGPTGRNVRSLTDDLFEQARAVQTLTDEYEAAQRAQQQLAADLSAFGGLGVPSSTLEIQAAIRQRDRELRERRERASERTELTPRQRRLQQAGQFLPTTAGAEAERAGAIRDAAAGGAFPPGVLEETNALLEQRARILANIRTPTEAYAAAQAQLNELKEAGLLSEEEYNRALGQAQGQLMEQSQAYQILAESADIFARTVSSGIADAIFAGDSLSDTFANITESIARAIAEALIFQAIMAAIGSPTGSATGGPSGLFALFSRQHGGPVRPGQPYLVGESGRELFVPDTSGMIVPNARLGGRAGAQIVINNNVAGAQVTARQDQQTGRIDIGFDEIATQTLLKPGSQFSRGLRDRFGLNFQTTRR